MRVALSSTRDLSEEYIKTKLMTRIKAIAFDAWGTLFDEGGDSLRATVAKIVTDIGLRMDSEDFLSLWKEFYSEDISSSYNIRKTRISSLSRVFGTLGVAGDAEEYVDYLIDNRCTNSVLYPDVSPVLQSLGGLVKCIISNIDNDTLQKTLDKNGLVFEHVVTSESVRAYKPDPKIFLEALKLLGCDSKEVIFVGDSQEDDVVGARKVGIVTVWINRRKERLKTDVPRPDFEIEDLRGLLDILRELSAHS